MADTNYFVCTLGQAVGANQTSHPRSETITGFLDHQARVVPNAPAVGFPIPARSHHKSWESVILTFQELAECSVTSSHILRLSLNQEDDTRTRRTVALLCPSSLEFLFTWLGLMRLGYAVLLIAVKSSVSTFSNLPSLYDESVGHANHQFTIMPIPKDLSRQVHRNDKAEAERTTHGHGRFPGHQQQKASDIAFFFHTSGTSSGLPKPVPLDHYGAVGVLPCLPQGHSIATFTTTPLYHGGIADCFRAWTSGALIWLFPGKDEPITTSNILKSLDCARQAEGSDDAAPVKYFSSVPYILQMVSTEPEGMKMLQSMELVGVGGAALPQDVGDSLVDRGVNLVSRFGSAECGFLLSSHRNYETDKEWQYLRSNVPGFLTFEEQQDDSGLSELVIQPSWPHMGKRNREDGSLATADLFAPHPTIENAWKYHSRADSQLTLITGKKFDPAPLEAAIASHELLSDALIFGNGMQSAGALLFRSEKSHTMEKDRLLDKVWPAINKLNKEGQAHTRLARPMLIIMETGAPGLEKSSKGTVLRPRAEKTYQKQIQDAYDQSIANGEDGARVTIPDDDIPTAVLEIIKTVIGTNDRIPEDADLFSYGVDSVACMAIRAKLQSRILDPHIQALPLNIVYDCGNIRTLSKYILNVRKGRVTESEDEIQLMKDLVSRYSVPTAPPPAITQSNSTHKALEIGHGGNDNPRGERILLTGATGALGAHILHLLRSTTSVSQITCLVRASSPLAAHERVSKSLTARAKPGLPPFSPIKDPSSAAEEDSATATPTVICLPCSLSNPALGLSPETYTHLGNTTTVIIHAAWAVNFTARLRSFEKDHIAGLTHLLDLTTAAPRSAEPIRFLFLSSTASVTSTPVSKYPIAEHVSTNPDEASPLGYSRSKWVAENLIDAFHRQLSPSPQTNQKNKNHNDDTILLPSSLPPTLTILRIGQLTSDTTAGIWNTSEAWPLMLSTAPTLHALPDLGTQPLDWLPVDIAAAAVLEVAHSMKHQPAKPVADAESNGCPVLHILNPATTPTWSNLLACIRGASPAMDLEVFRPAEWVRRVEAFEVELPAKRLVGLWRGSFGEGEGDGRGVKEGEGDGDGRIDFAMERAREMSGVMREVGALDGEFLVRMWRWVEGLVVAEGN